MCYFNYSLTNYILDHNILFLHKLSVQVLQKLFTSKVPEVHLKILVIFLSFFFRLEMGNGDRIGTTGAIVYWHNWCLKCLLCFLKKCFQTAEDPLRESTTIPKPLLKGLELPTERKSITSN